MSRAETRHCQRPAEIRTDDDGNKTAVGYASVFYRESGKGTEYRLWDDLVEHIMPGAFDRALSEGQNVRALFNHDPNKVLGSVSGGTMRLSVDETGLRYEIDLPDTATGNELAVLLERGDITGSSFGFIPKETVFRDVEDGDDVREIVDVDVRDVGPVTFPAYESTTASLRSEYDSWKGRDARVAAINARVINTRAGVVETEQKVCDSLTLAN